MVQVIESNSEVVRKRRKKIWQIDSCYHCSVIGVCLNRRDLKRIAAKSSFSFTPGATDFSVHQRLSSISTTRSDKARVLQKILDNKHRQAIKKYAGCMSEKEIEQQWKSDMALKKGIAGSYWAIMTHPLCQHELLGNVYGASHMLSYDIFADFQRDEKKIGRLVRQYNLQKERSEKTAVAQKRKILLLQQKVSDLKKESSRHRQDRFLSDKLKKENDALKKKLTQLSGQAGRDANNALVALEKENGALYEEIKRSNERAEGMVDQLESVRQAHQILEDRLMNMEQEKIEVQEELRSLETMLTQTMTMGAECESCDELAQGTCKGQGLIGQTILYVGGRKNMVSHYRDMVEKYGGTFMHHDGGKESSRSVLPRILSGADAVLCPIDCVSHDACLCVKKICKRNCKPFVMMRSSGLSSLARGLGEIVQ